MNLKVYQYSLIEQSGYNDLIKHSNDYVELTRSICSNKRF